MNDVLDLPFDQYQRYRLVMDLLDEVRGDARTLRILDVGGRTALLRSFLPDDEVVLVDVEASDEPGLVLGDGSALPFADGAFDAVLAFDTLEHGQNIVLFKFLPGTGERIQRPLLPFLSRQTLAAKAAGLLCNAAGERTGLEAAQILWLNRLAFPPQGDGSLDHILEFSHVAGKRIAQQELTRRGRKALQFFVHLD